jgi:hypothetical protein
MNFLKMPHAGLQPNTPMDDDQRAVAGSFVDELIDLEITGLAPEGVSTLLNAPLFVIAKEGQPGEWRVISDMLQGGQNACIGNDPIFLPRTAHILDQTYTGGYSVVVDASKFFYQFPMHPNDRPHLGLLHPLANEIYEYWASPWERPTLLLLQDGMACRLCTCLRLVSGNFKGLLWQIVGGLASLRWANTTLIKATDMS